MITYRADILLPKIPKANGSKLIRAMFAQYLASNLQVAHFSTLQRSPFSSCFCHHHTPSYSQVQAVLVQSAEIMGWVLQVPIPSWKVHQGTFTYKRGAELLPLGRGLRRFN